MRTRKTKRKTISLQGRYFTGQGKPVDVTLSDLSVGGCRIFLGKPGLKPGTPIQIFVGSSGPHRAVVKWTKDKEAGVTFSVPLSEDLCNSLESEEGLAPVPANASAEFEDMGNARPQRYC